MYPNQRNRMDRIIHPFQNFGSIQNILIKPSLVYPGWITLHKTITYPTCGKGKSSTQKISKVPLKRDMLVPWRVLFHAIIIPPPTFLHQKSRLEIWEVLTNDEQPCWVIFDAGKNHLKEGVLFNPTSGTGARFSSILNKRFISKSVFTCSMIILGLTPNVFGKALARQCGWKLDGNALNSSHQKVQNSACAIHLKDTPDP